MSDNKNITKPTREELESLKKIKETVIKDKKIVKK